MPLKAPPKPTAKTTPPPLPAKAPAGSTDPDDELGHGGGTSEELEIEIHGDGLPDAPTDQDVTLTSLRWLFVAPPGFGKTEFFSLFPDCLMLACEEGHKFVKGYKLIIDGWAGTGQTEDSDGNIHVSFLEAVKRIKASSRFKFIIIDTLDSLVKKCIDYHIGKANQAHLSDLGEYGKGYDLGMNDPIRRSLNELFSTGRGIGLITHQEIKSSNFKKSATTSKKETSLPNGIHKIVYPQMDVIIHGEFGGVRDGFTHRDRIIKSEGSEDILAKNRGGVLPPAWIAPLDGKERAEQIMSFFHPDPETREAAKQAAYAQYCEFYEGEG